MRRAEEKWSVRLALAGWRRSVVTAVARAHAVVGGHRTAVDARARAGADFHAKLCAGQRSKRLRVRIARGVRTPSVRRAGNVTKRAATAGPGA